MTIENTLDMGQLFESPCPAVCDTSVSMIITAIIMNYIYILTQSLGGILEKKTMYVFYLINPQKIMKKCYLKK